MKKKTIIITIVVILFVTLMIGFFYHFWDRNNYELNLPQLEKLKNISLQQNENKKIINDNEEMKDLLYVLNGINRTTKEESIQDEPVNINNEIKVDFNFMESGTSTIFIYEKNNKYYIEQPYNGIYQISGDEYNSIQKYFNQEKPSFLGKVIESHSSYIIVEPNESEHEEKSYDKFRIELGDDNDTVYEVGSHVKITYTGVIKESYPAQIEATKIELKSVDGFEIIFNQEPGHVKRQIIDKNTSKQYDYKVYIYNGHVDVIIDSTTYSLEEALKDNKITMDEIIAKANKDFPNAVSYDDGGSIEYHYDDYTIIKFQTLDGNRDVYIGNKNLKITHIQ